MCVIQIYLITRLRNSTSLLLLLILVSSLPQHIWKEFIPHVSFVRISTSVFVKINLFSALWLPYPCPWVSLRAMVMIQTIWVFVQRLLDKWVFYNFWESSVVHDSYSCRCLFIHLNLRSKPLLRKKAPTSIWALIWRQKTFNKSWSKMVSKHPVQLYILGMG